MQHPLTFGDNCRSGGVQRHMTIWDAVSELEIGSMCLKCSTDWTDSGVPWLHSCRTRPDAMTVYCNGCYLEHLRNHEKASTGEGGLLLLGNLQQPLHKGSHPLGGHVRLHGFEEEGQEHWGLA